MPSKQATLISVGAIKRKMEVALYLALIVSAGNCAMSAYHVTYPGNNQVSLAVALLAFLSLYAWVVAASVMAWQLDDTATHSSERVVRAKRTSNSYTW